MKINKTLILKLEKLASLELSEDERTGIEKDLNNILGMVSKMDELNLDDIEPLTYLSDTTNAFRPDNVQGETDRTAALNLAPEADEAGFLVPKVVRT